MRLIRTIVSMLTIALFVAGCAKEKDDKKADVNKYYMRFKADGQQVQFVDQAALQAAFGNSGNQHVLTVMGFVTNTNASVVAYDNKPITEGTYAGYRFEGTEVIGGMIAYQNTAGIAYGTNGANPEVELIVTMFNTTEVKGTFSGVIKQNGGTENITITDGEFYVKRVN